MPPVLDCQVTSYLAPTPSCSSFCGLGLSDVSYGRQARTRLVAILGAAAQKNSIDAASYARYYLPRTARTRANCLTINPSRLTFF